FPASSGLPLAAHLGDVDPASARRARAQRRHDPPGRGLGAGPARPGPYQAVQQFLGSWIGLLLVFGWSVALFYHLCNGIRHLWWDAGHALELKAVYTGGWIVVAATALLTLAAWIAGLSGWSR